MLVLSPDISIKYSYRAIVTVKGKEYISEPINLTVTKKEKKREKKEPKEPKEPKEKKEKKDKKEKKEKGDRKKKDD